MQDGKRGADPRDEMYQIAVSRIIGTREAGTELVGLNRQIHGRHDILVPEKTAKIIADTQGRVISIEDAEDFRGVWIWGVDHQIGENELR